MIRHRLRKGVKIDLALIDRQMQMAEGSVARASHQLTMQRQTIQKADLSGKNTRIARMLLTTFEKSFDIHAASLERLRRLRVEAQAKRGSFLRQRWL
ncbi:hypothetical protein LAC81_37725 (plasmid) [Ensifer adhaerens]|uniref:hypothetical protein n=1 Tax=Ensifer adhaerens TaxID=106592 RepID=UPI001CBE1C4E|nr:hypothetical protein [Ensifer adhaerens]MBZ7927678.1 hypothetical protein [Ensifer adhaerens]UAX98074.1 hypothetical protein LAC78_39025 [Ensifer adhaerens]UAY05455.1 hypothetical protein LAC80_37740 [Ensifer adhaerens]UAY12833.1 hypothetical protein LAC81_37725 [Ensifer adhaerens]